jgi:type IV secretion system protein VirD4
MVMENPKPMFNGLVLGWDKRQQRDRNLGFRPPDGLRKPDWKPDVLETSFCYQGDSHLMTFAPTGSGKGRGVIIPTLLSYPGSIIVVDPKGENYKVTARRRREMGHQVVVLDPFEKVTSSPDERGRFNPLDIFKLPGTLIDADSTMLAWQLASGQSFSKDPFWDNVGTGFLSGLIAHVGTGVPAAERDLNKVLHYVYSDDAIYGLAVLLDSKTVTCAHARREIAAFLQLPERDTRPSVLATALSWLKALNTECVEQTIESSSFDLKDLMEGKPLTIYICIPPEKLVSHKSLLKIWIAACLTTVMRRYSRPEKSTLFLLDECAQLGSMPLLEQAVTLLRGYGLQVWSFWQDLEQVKSNYPTGHMTLINNASVLQAFGMSNRKMAQQVSELMDVSTSQVLSMKPTEQAIAIRGEGTTVNRIPDYLTDRVFKGLWDPNPFFSHTARPTIPMDVDAVEEQSPGL